MNWLIGALSYTLLAATLGWVIAFLIIVPHINRPPTKPHYKRPTTRQRMESGQK